MRANPFRLGIRLGKNESCSPGSASDDCKKTYKGATDSLGCFERWTQVSRGEFDAEFLKSAAVETGLPKRQAARLYFQASSLKKVDARMDVRRRV